jgi:hypothetical protein
MAWTPLSDRAESLQQHLQLAAEQSSPPAAIESFYNQNDLGLLSDGELETWLSQANLPALSEAPLDPPELREEDRYSTKTLRWLQQNAATAADKTLAKQRYRELLFDLWRKYVAQTGQAWYPPLRNDLWDRYQVMASDPDNA